jgi:hypothetical protein
MIHGGYACAVEQYFMQQSMDIASPEIKQGSNLDSVGNLVGVVAFVVESNGSGGGDSSIVFLAQQDLGVDSGGSGGGGGVITSG